MIPLLGTSRLLGEWPPTADTVLLQVMTPRGAQDAALEFECFYGTLAPFAVAAMAGEDDALPDCQAPALRLPPALGYLDEGDVVAIARKNGRTRVLFRVRSHHNSLLVTERCDNYCVMCSQPPRRVNDDALIDEILALLPRLPESVREIGFTGGEPTLRGERFIEVLRLAKQCLPDTAVHVLSNGRRFADREFARLWAGVDHPDLMAGIPVYSDLSYLHDYVVQADGAFDETIRGIVNLKSFAQRVEVRVVLHRHTIGRLPRLAEFLARNLSFVDHVALMGLELMGFGKANQDDLWIRTQEHADTIGLAAEILDQAGLHPSIYNAPLCLLAPRSRKYAVASISDWKREYWPECDDCVLKADCGGAFFSTRARLAEEIRPIRENEAAAAT